MRKFFAVFGVAALLAMPWFLFGALGDSLRIDKLLQLTIVPAYSSVSGATADAAADDLILDCNGAACGMSLLIPDTTGVARIEARAPSDGQLTNVIDFSKVSNGIIVYTGPAAGTINFRVNSNTVNALQIAAASSTFNNVLTMSSTFNASSGGTFGDADGDNFAMRGTMTASASGDNGWWRLNPATEKMCFGDAAVLDACMWWAATGQINTDSDLKLTVAGNGLFIKEGTNATMGTDTLVAGTRAVATNLVTANSRIFITGYDDNGGTAGFLRITGRTAGTSFTVTSSTGALDTSKFSWLLVEPAP